jgi:hypothetical protein
MLTRRLFWQIPLTVLVCIAGSLAAAWLVSQALGFSTNVRLVVMLSAVLSAVAIGVELRGTRRA